MPWFIFFRTQNNSSLKNYYLLISVIPNIRNSILIKEMETFLKTLIVCSAIIGITNRMNINKNKKNNN